MGELKLALDNIDYRVMLILSANSGYLVKPLKNMKMNSYELRQEAEYLRQRAAESMIALGECPESQAAEAEAAAAEIAAEAAD